jgi:hypothetical protein
MRNGIYWLVVGGLTFWLPAIIVGAASKQNVNVVLLNVAALAGLILVRATSWIYTRHFPRWDWVLVGIYVLGPVCMLAPSAFTRIPPSPSNSGGALILVLLCLFPPTTLWFSLLNGMIFSVLIATLTLPFLSAVGPPDTSERNAGRYVP